jgi:DEAD/DEAH box helicase domain-containing protein
LEIEVEALPMGPEDYSPIGIETVILAEEVPMRRNVVEVKEEEGEESGMMGGFEPFDGLPR